MNEFAGKRQMAFPIAAITAVLYILLYTLYQVLYARMIVGSSFWETMGNIYGITFYIAWIFMIVILFLRQRKFLIIAPLGIYIVRSIVNLISSISYAFQYSWYVRWMIFPALLMVIVWALLIVFAVSQDWNVMPGAVSVFQSIWFVPAVLTFIVELLAVSFVRYLMRKSIFLGIIDLLMTLIYIATIALLGLWLTHPYGQQPYNPGFNGMPPQGQPYPQRMQGVNRPTQQKAFCTGCGKELQPNENFCIRCGTKRPN